MFSYTNFDVVDISMINFMFKWLELEHNIISEV